MKDSNSIIKITLYVLICFLVPLTTIHSQTHRLDSLKKILPSQVANNRIKTLSELCYQLTITGQQDSLSNYADELILLSTKQSKQNEMALGFYYQAQFNRMDSALFYKYTYQSMELAEKIPNVTAIAMNCLAQGIRWRTTGEYEKAIQILNSGLFELKSLTTSRSHEIKTDLNSALSSVYHNQGKYVEALSYGLEANRMAESIRDSLRIAKSYNNLSGVYGELSSTENNLGSNKDRLRYRNLAKAFTRKFFEISIHQPNKRMPAVAAYNLGLLYNDEHQTDSSNSYLLKSIQIGLTIQYNELLANAYSTIGLNFDHTHPDSALYYFEKSISYAKRSGLKALLANMLLNKASIYEQRGRQKEAFQLARQSLTLNQETDELDGMMASFKLLSNLSEKAGNNGEALNYYRSYVKIKDSILNETNFAKLEEVKTQFETELKDSQIESLNQKGSIQALEIQQRNYLVLALSIFIVMAACAIFLFIRQRTIVAREKVLDMENRFLRSQLNPHFLFNALSAIQQFIYEQTDRTIAADYLGKFSSLTRRILNYTREDYISLAQEIEFLKDYLDLQKIRFEVPFDYSIKLPDSIDAEDIYLPPMITQPFIENSIEHGILHKQEKGKIEIEFKAVNEQVVITIQDNGIGRELAAFNKRNEKHRSLATQITRERLANLQRSTKRKSELTIHDLTDTIGNIVGTQVVFNLPLIQDI